MKKLTRAFYNRNTIEVAIGLLGCEITSTIGGAKTGGIIVETEAYRGPDDPACHAFHGRTKRNSVMFGPCGILYVYFTYGNHFMLNVVTEQDGYPAAVLLRGIEPRFGMDIMRQRRETDIMENLCSGPGKLAKALGITTTENNTDLCGPMIYVKEPPEQKLEIMSSPRIGIGERWHRKLWRFYVAGSPHVSKGVRYVKDNSLPLSEALKMHFDLDH
jgi:DNA-3-methyladenine glycosylase